MSEDILWAEATLGHEAEEFLTQIQSQQTVRAGTVSPVESVASTKTS